MNFRSSALPLGLFGLLVFIGILGSSASWTQAHAILFGGAGLLMILFPPRVALPRSWWLLAILAIVASLAVFLPASLFPYPAWRSQLDSLGVPTGNRLVIQAEEAAEYLASFVIVLITGLWLLGHRLSSSQAAKAALLAVTGVALYALLAWVMRDALAVGRAQGHFGFFPNRNHTATLLSMGVLCGLGSIAQAIRDRRNSSLFLAVPATLICLVAVLAWSISRSGIVLIGAGTFAWLLLLGRRYLGRHGLAALGLGVLLAGGLFLLADSRLKERLQQTVVVSDETATPEASSPGEFRLPTWLDTLDLIRTNPLTGVGAGQFRAVFPQYRQRTAIANHADNVHPESDWLWLAAECGVPAAVLIAVLVLLVAVYGVRQVRDGRARALRAALLIAGMIAVFHGLFDVPCHRTSLAWSAVLLLGAALPLPENQRPLSSRSLPAWVFRVFGGAMLALGGLLVASAWFHGPVPRLALGEQVYRRGFELHKQDEAQRAAAKASGQVSYQPDPQDDPLEKAFRETGEALQFLPLDRSLYQLRGQLGLSFDDRDAEVDRAFAIERALDPTWIQAPLRQAEAWAHYDVSRSAALWREALERADRLDSRTGGHLRREKVVERIRYIARGKPALEAAAASLETP